MASPAALPVLPCLDAMMLERPPPALVRDVLEEIFLRVASPADLARASAVCVSFRGLISSPSFLRRYRAVHPPLLLGFFNRDGLHPVEATHLSAAVSRGVARKVDLSFLPLDAQWRCVYDVRDGRVLVGCKGSFHCCRRRLYWDIAVCDPMFRRYLPLPPITDDLLASVGLDNKDMHHSEASLFPSGGTEDEETSFSVICYMHTKTRLAVFIFSSTSPAHWGAVKSTSWADLGLPEEIEHCLNQPVECVYGCFYWKLYRRNELLKLDKDTMEFSKYDLPPDHDHRTIAIVEAGEGKVAMFSTLINGSVVQYYTFMQNGAEKSHKWHLKSTIPLPDHGPRNCFFDGQAEGYVFLAQIIDEQDKPYLEYFSLEVKSYNIEKACTISGRTSSVPYFGFPASLSPRRIQGGHGESGLLGNLNSDVED